VDSALEELESYKLLSRYGSPGDNQGQIYELLMLDETPIPHLNRFHIVTILRQVADDLENSSQALTLQQITQWSRISHQARRLLSDQS
jgi:hypothetical protein